ncbi:hypothetical protein [Roseateles sp. MS654]|uniref:hypothetical protein n=1 Tax=Roseateles sp. MS654 TaxID=3412685 RepID=UPI003C2F6E2D
MSDDSGLLRSTKAQSHRCMRQLPGAAGYCSQHRYQRTLGEAIVLGMGALAGHALVPGLGGAVGGALGAKVLQPCLLLQRANTVLAIREAPI